MLYICVCFFLKYPSSDDIWYKNSETLLVIPFAGSGSECVSAKKNNVNFIGFEINSDYIHTANERLDEI